MRCVASRHLWIAVFLAAFVALIQTSAFATVSVTTTTTAATLATAITAGNSGITLTGTPVLSNGSSANISGTFTTSSSTLGIASGIVLGTGNVANVPGNPVGAANLSSAGTAIGNTPTNEFDIATFTFSFIPNPGVNRMSLASVFASEEYNEYVNTAYTDNFSMTLNGGVYTNQNVATIPGTSTGTDINSVNNGANSGYYRDNTSSTPPINDIRMDGATTVFINAFNVVPGTTYTLTIRIADVGDNSYDSVVFVSTSTILNSPPALDLSVAASGTGYGTTWVQGLTASPVAASDDSILDDGTTISSATITINSPVATDLLTAGSLPGGIVASSYNAGTGVMTLTGVATIAQYRSALQLITYSSTAVDPAGPAKSIRVVVNDGVDNSNIATATINIAALRVVKSSGIPTVAAGASNTLTDAGDTISYSFAVTNMGSVALTNVVPVDQGTKFNGVNGTGTLSAFSPASASIAVGASQTFTATYTLTATDVANGAGVTNGVANTARATGREPGSLTATSSPSTATTSILVVAGVTVTKTAAAPTIAAGSNATITDAGDSITYTYVVKNVGSVTITQAFPSDAGPKFNGINGTNTLSAFSPAGSVTLVAGASQTFTATYVLSITDMQNAVGIANGVTNTASATARNPSNAVITAPSSSAATTITAAPILTLSKTFVLTDTPGLTAARADLNELVTYTFTVRNTGNVPINTISISDLHGTPAVLVPNGAGGITSETLTIPGPYGAGASTDATANDGVWSLLAPGATITFSWPHTVTQAEIDNG
jgi:uncharacterized repeat protein (TIGR01451 family)